MFAIIAQVAMDGGTIISRDGVYAENCQEQFQRMSMDGRYIENAGAIFLQTIDLTNSKSFSTKQP